MMAEIHPWEITQFYWFCTWTDLPNWRKNISLPRRPYVFEVHRYNTPKCPTCIIHQIVLFSSIFIQTSKDQDSLCFTVWVVKTEQVRELLLRIIIKAPFLFHCMGILKTRRMLPYGCFSLMWTALRYTKWSGIHRSPMIPPRIVIILNLLSILKF